MRQNVVTGISSDMDVEIKEGVSEGDICCDFLGYGSDGRTAGKSCDAVSKREYMSQVWEYIKIALMNIRSNKDGLF